MGLQWFKADQAKQVWDILEGKPRSTGATTSPSSARAVGLTVAGVDHIQLRIETVQLLIEGASKDPDRFYGLCQQIGRTAAHDLWKGLKKFSQGAFLPSDYDALVAIWNHWDERGNWGTISIRPPAANQTSEGRVTFRHIEVANNFLRYKRPGSQRVTSGNEHNFWSGYIDGFLTEVIGHLVEPVYHWHWTKHVPSSSSALSFLDAAKGRLSDFHRVNNVSLDESLPSGNGFEVYRVVFAPDPLLPLWDQLGKAYIRLQAKQYAMCYSTCSHGVHLAKVDKATSTSYRKASACLAPLEQARLTRLELAEPSDSASNASEAYVTFRSLIHNLREPDAPSDDEDD
ncbi:MAG: hypothetical protein ACKVS8_10945 [Phycisphaerales bacterium]